jgi:hypothetical protein
LTGAEKNFWNRKPPRFMLYGTGCLIIRPNQFWLKIVLLPCRTFPDFARPKTPMTGHVVELELDLKE